MQAAIQCEVTADGSPCESPAAFLYIGSGVRRLICARHAREYRAGSKVGGPTGVVAEVALLELIPSREALQLRLERAIKVAKKFGVIVESFHQLRSELTSMVVGPWWSVFTLRGRLDETLGILIAAEKAIDREYGYPELGGDL